MVASLLVLLAGCGAGTVAVDVPAPRGDAARFCADLVGSLPESLEEGAVRDVEPESAYVAAYADPAIVLRCGVDEPAEYGPTVELVTVNDVDWLPVEQPDGVAFYAPGLIAWIRVDVPSAYTPGTFALTELSDAIRVSTAPPDESPTWG